MANLGNTTNMTGRQINLAVTNADATTLSGLNTNEVIKNGIIISAPQTAGRDTGEYAVFASDAEGSLAQLTYPLKENGGLSVESNKLKVDVQAPLKIDAQKVTLSYDGKTLKTNNNVLTVDTQALNVASASTYGVVKIDGTTIKMNNGQAYVPLATMNNVGVSKVDGSIINITADGFLTVNDNWANGNPALMMGDNVTLSLDTSTNKTYVNLSNIIGDNTLTTKGSGFETKIAVNIDNESLKINGATGKLYVDSQKMPQASGATYGVVKLDDNTIVKNESDGKIKVNTEKLSEATPTSPGVVKIDGDTITKNSNGQIQVISDKMPHTGENIYGLIKIDGSTIQLDSNEVAHVPVATNTSLGVVKIDNDTIRLNANNQAYAQKCAHNTYGVVKIDTSTQTANTGRTLKIDDAGYLAINIGDGTITSYDGNGNGGLRVVTKELVHASKGDYGVVKIDGSSLKINDNGEVFVSYIDTGNVNRDDAATYNGLCLVSSNDKLYLGINPDKMRTATQGTWGVVKIPDENDNKNGCSKAIVAENGVIFVDEGILTKDIINQTNISGLTVENNKIKANICESNKFGIVKPDNSTIAVDNGVLSVDIDTVSEKLYATTNKPGIYEFNDDEFNFDTTTNPPTISIKNMGVPKTDNTTIKVKSTYNGQQLYANAKGFVTQNYGLSVSNNNYIYMQSATDNRYGTVKIDGDTIKLNGGKIGVDKDLIKNSILAELDFNSSNYLQTAYITDYNNNNKQIDDSTTTCLPVNMIVNHDNTSEEIIDTYYLGVDLGNALLTKNNIYTNAYIPVSNGGVADKRLMVYSYTYINNDYLNLGLSKNELALELQSGAYALVPKTELSRYATKSSLSNYVTTKALEDFAEKADFDNLVNSFDTLKPSLGDALNGLSDNDIQLARLISKLINNNNALIAAINKIAQVVNVNMTPINTINDNEIQLNQYSGIVNNLVITNTSEVSNNGTSISTDNKQDFTILDFDKGNTSSFDKYVCEIIRINYDSNNKDIDFGTSIYTLQTNKREEIQQSDVEEVCSLVNGKPGGFSNNSPQAILDIVNGIEDKTEIKSAYELKNALDLQDTIYTNIAAKVYFYYITMLNTSTNASS